MRKFARFSLLFTFSFSTALLAQTDPGVRPGPPGAGQPIAGLTAAELAAFQGQATSNFTANPGAGFGTGPRFNGTGCVGCHAFPTAGGSSPQNNPQIAMAALRGGTNTIPAFLTPTSPAMAVRFIRSSAALGKKKVTDVDGGVHTLFTIVGRTDAPAGCNIQQEDFSNMDNLSFRITTPTFGLGLIEAITDSTIMSNLASDAATKALLGISGRVNVNGNDGTITRFGWKAQNKSLLLFSAEAYNVEMGVTNEIFTQNRDETRSCISKGSPEDFFNFETNTMSHIQAFATFMKFLDQPARSCGGAGQPACSPSVQNGQALFTSVGCAQCHTPSLQTDKSTTLALSEKPVNLYSDLALHYMGEAFEDDVVQGIAQSGEFRSAPLWGLGQRIFFLHDGRTTDLLAAIKAHSGDKRDSPLPPNGKFLPIWPKEEGFNKVAEAKKVTDNFNRLTASEKQDMLNFLRTL